ncbi:MAG TPA: hypothetical protein DEG43_03555 [Acidimicrobiaceae bacterium]|nr:hypothetical protein [Acidimicrobiaceae bacterium]
MATKSLRVPRFRPRRPGWGRAAILVAAASLLVLFVSTRGVGRLVTDYLFFQEIGAGNAWKTQVGAKVGLAAVFGLGFFLIAYVNLLIANRVAPLVRVIATGDDLFDRYRTLVEPRQRPLQIGVSVALGLITGVGSSTQWNSLLLFLNGASLKRPDTVTGADLGFHLFRLPFIDFLVSWLFSSILIVTVLVVVVHVLSGALRLPGAGLRSGQGARVQVSILIALLGLLKAADYFLDRYRLVTSRNERVDGALYRQIHADIPAATLLCLVALLFVVLVLWNLRRDTWSLPMITLGLWVATSVVVGTLYPAGVQQFKVVPEESRLEARYIKRNIEATSKAFGLDQIRYEDFNYSPTITDTEITANASTVSNIRILDPSIVPSTFDALQSKKGYLGFEDLDVDRYEIDSIPTQVLVGARNLNVAEVPNKSWEGRHLTYTNGEGIALAPANGVTATGVPDFLIGDIPPAVDESIGGTNLLERPEIYFGEFAEIPGEEGYAIVGTEKEAKGAGYAGDGGIQLNSFLRKAAFAARFGDWNILISDFVTDSSRVIVRRNLTDRLTSVAPFVRWDSDPYPVLDNGRINYVVDGYLTTDMYPSSQSVPGELLGPDGEGSQPDFNYIRNSVKAVVDAYSGSVSLYRTDSLYGSEDPLVDAYSKAFPGLFLPVDSMPAGIRSHLRYPEDMFKVQTEMLGRYHLRDATAFFEQRDGWAVAQEPSQSVRSESGATAQQSRNARIQPYYLQMRLPGETSDEFLLFRPFVPYTSADAKTTKKQLNAFMVGRSDPGKYGELVVYSMTQEGASGERQLNSNVPGPLTIANRIVSDTESGLSDRLTLLNAKGGQSQARFGNMVIVPIGDSLLYVRPLYVMGETEGDAAQLRLVVVVNEDRVAYGATLADALSSMFPSAEVATREAGSGNEPPKDPSAPAPDEPDTTSSAAELVAQALNLFEEADAALKRGGVDGLTEYQTKTAAATELVRKAAERLGTTSAGSGTEIQSEK